MSGRGYKIVSDKYYARTGLRYDNNSGTVLVYSNNSTYSERCVTTLMILTVVLAGK
jgi:hypothetical protein